MSNTAIQMKSHTGRSACNKSKHNERKDNHIKNPNFVILYKDNYHTFHYKEPVKKPKTTQKMLDKEKALKGQIATLNAKINTYEKRLVEYQSRENPNLKQIDKLKAKIEDCKTKKAELPKQQDRRGRPITKRYVEFEFSLTNSNHNKHDKRVQQAFIKSVNELREQNPIFRHLKPTSDIMHLDQESLHIHNINKINSKKCLTSILKELDPQNSNRNFLSNMQNQFNELVRKNMKELDLEIEPQQKGIKYLPLKKYKELTKYKYKEQQNQQQQPQQPQPKKENLLEKFDEIDKKSEDNFFNKLNEKNIQLQKNANNLDIKDILNGVKKEEKQEEKEVKNPPKNLDKLIERQQQRSAFEAQKKRLNEQFKETLNEKQNETQNEKVQEKSNSKKHSRSR